jgi:hypothetical protein
LANLDVAQEAGGRDRPLVKEVDSVAVTDDLVVEFVPRGDGALTPATAPILNGLEIVLQDAGDR